MCKNANYLPGFRTTNYTNSPEPNDIKVTKMYDKMTKKEYLFLTSETLKTRK